MKIRLIDEDGDIIVEIETGKSIVDAVNCMEKITTYTVREQEYVRDDKEIHYNCDERILTIYVRRN